MPYLDMPGQEDTVINRQGDASTDCTADRSGTQENRSSENLSKEDRSTDESTFEWTIGIEAIFATENTQFTVVIA